MQQNELKHYGVLGMKWGVHRARKNAEKAAKYKKKGDTGKADKYAAKAKQIESKHRKLGGSKTYDRVASTSTGKLVAESMLMGTYGALNYNRARSAGASRGKAAIAGIISNMGNTATSGILSVVEPRLGNGTGASKSGSTKSKKRTESSSERDLKPRVNDIFKQHPDLYDDFGGPDQIDDYDLLAYVMKEKGYK